MALNVGEKGRASANCQLPQGGKPSKKKFKAYPIGYFDIDIAELQTGEGKLQLYVAINRTSKFAFVQLAKKTGRTSASAFLEALIAAVPYKIHTVPPTVGSSSPSRRAMRTSRRLDT
ncbi:hypothetical protein ACVIHH_008288 [Bradyrhizobium sp. USDA 4518]